MVDHPSHGPRSDMPPIFYAPDPSEACRYTGCNNSRYANGFCRDHYIECMKARHWDEWPRERTWDEWSRERLAPWRDTSHREKPLSDSSETPWEQS